MIIKSNHIQTKHHVVMDCAGQEIIMGLDVNQCIEGTDAAAKACHDLTPGESKTIDLTRVESECSAGYIDFESLNSLMIQNQGEGTITFVRPVTGATELIDPKSSFSVNSSVGWMEAAPWEIVITNPFTKPIKICMMLAGKRRAL